MVEPDERKLSIPSATPDVPMLNVSLEAASTRERALLVDPALILKVPLSGMAIVNGEAFEYR